MNRFIKLFSFFILMLLILFFVVPKKPYIKKSRINKDGLFAPKDYQKGEIILSNVFPNKGNDVTLFNPIETNIFERFISNEAKYINHCSVNYNSDMISDDHKIYKLIAERNINKDNEITVNYDKVSKKFPFISGSKEGYEIC